jgi:hypothetical protein
MIIVAWILMIVFGWFALLGWIKYWFGSVKLSQLILIMFWSVIAALCAGVIFGGLFSNYIN